MYSGCHAAVRMLSVRTGSPPSSQAALLGCAKLGQQVNQKLRQLSIPQDDHLPQAQKVSL